MNVASFTMSGPAIVLAALVFIGGSSVRANAQTAVVFGEARVFQREKIEMSQTALATRGNELRAAIDARYKELIGAKAIRPSGTGRNFISELVAAYIPIGSSFEDAEVILRSAGLTVGPRGKNNIAHDKSEVVAQIAEYSKAYFGRTTLYISMEPTNPDDWTTVGKITAEFILTTI